MRAYGTPIVIRNKTDARRLDPLPLEHGDGAFDEAWLRDLIQVHPESLPVDEIEPGFQRLVPICTEFPTKHGPIDNFFLTPAGDVVLVEVKLWRNPEVRRKVVAQALDYASCVFELDYEEVESSVRSRLASKGRKLNRLYDLISDNEADALDEPEFVDAVNANLRRGRALILVVGDGIRTETTRLTALLQSHAGAHFSFGLVEMAVYNLQDGEWLICPRVLARTEAITRGIVHIRDDRTQVILPLEHTPSLSRPQNITAEQFYAAMSELNPALPTRLRSFIEKLEPLGVYPDFLRSLNLKWDPPEGKPINLGYIKRDGQVWTDASNWFAPKDLSHQYNEELAKALGLEVNRETLGECWHIRHNGRAARIDHIADKLDAWLPVIRDFVDRIRERLVTSSTQ